MKVNTHPLSLGLIPIHVDPRALPFFQVTCNFVTDLLVSTGFDSLMVMVNHSSMKRVICISCHKTINTETTTQNFIDHVFQHFGLPNSFLSDRGPQFSLQVFKKIAWILGFKTFRSTAYYPQTDRETECVNQELKIYMHIFCSNNPETWSFLILIMKFCYNQRFHSTTKKFSWWVINHETSLCPSTEQTFLLQKKDSAPSKKHEMRQLQHMNEQGKRWWNALLEALPLSTLEIRFG